MEGYQLDESSENGLQATKAYLSSGSIGTGCKSQKVAETPFEVILCKALSGKASDPR
jgi:hypothetical protein